MLKIIHSLKDGAGSGRFFRFCLVGAVNTATDALLFFCAVHFLGVNISIAQVIGYASGMIVSYLLNGRYTFRSKNLLHAKRIAGFIAVNVFSLFVVYHRYLANTADIFLSMQYRLSIE